MAERLQEERGPDLRDYWRIIVAGRWYIVLSFVVVVASTAFFTFTADPVYEATGKVLVLTNRGKALGEESSTLNIPTSLSGDIRNEVPNWIEIMTSRGALEKALAHLEADPQFAALIRGEADRGSLFDKVAQALSPGGADTTSRDEEEREQRSLLTAKGLEGRMSVNNVRGTDLIEVKATGGSPLEAKLITDALIQAYLELDTEITKTTLASVKDFLSNQLEKTKATLLSAEEQFAQFKQESDLELGIDQLEGSITQLEQLKAQVEVEQAEEQANLEALDHRLGQLKQDLLQGEVAPTSGSAATPVNEEMIAQLRRLQDELQDLEEKRIGYLEAGDYAGAQEMENEISARKQAIEQLAQGKFEPFDLLPRYLALIKQQMGLYVAIDSLQNRVAALQQRIDREAERLATYRLPYERFQRDIQVNQDIYTMLREEYEKARIADVGELGGIRVVSWAAEPESPIKPKKKVNLILGALVGLTIGAGFAFLKEYLDNTYKTPKQVEQDLGIPSLGTVFALEQGQGRNGRGDRVRQIRQVLITKLDSKDPFVNAHIGVEASLRFASVDKPLKSLMVTSAVPEEGKSSLVANLGLVFSHVGRPTVIVDSDLRKPIFHRVFGLDRELGLTNAALGEVDLEEALVRPYVTPEGKAVGRGLAQLLLDLGKVSRDDLEEALKIQQRERLERGLEEILIDGGKLNPEDLEEARAKRGEGLENFYVLPPGPQPLNPTDFLGSKRMEALMAQLKERFEVVLLDSPPLVSVPDATVLSAQVDGVILVIEAQRTDKTDAGQAVEQLHKAGANIVGAVLNRVKRSTARYYGGYYGYYYSYSYYGEGEGRD